jgi:hypothetical protein
MMPREVDGLLESDIPPGEISEKLVDAFTLLNHQGYLNAKSSACRISPSKETARVESHLFT